MKLKSFIYLLACVLIIIGCEDNVSNQDEKDLLNDAQLIKSIQMATNKQNINTEDLPPASLTVLEQDYFDSYVEDAKIAPQLGYEVGLRKGKGAYRGDIRKTYFDLKGRELRADKDFGRGGREGKDVMECFSLVLPVTFIMPDDLEITVENKEDWSEIKNWYEAHPDSKERPVPQYPVEIIFKDGTTVTVDSDEVMRGIHARCGEGRDGDDGDKDRGNCFELVYPVTFVMPDRTTMTIESREDMAQLRTWYADHPDARERPTMEYPVEVKLKDGTYISLNNEEEMRGLRERCGEREGGDREKCFEFVYPVTYIMPDGSTISVDSREDMGQLRTWYTDNPGVRERPTLQYPVDVTLEDGTTITVNNDVEMRGVYARCDEGRGDGDGSGRP